MCDERSKINMFLPTVVITAIQTSTIVSRGDLLCRDDLLFRKCGARKRSATGSRTVYEHPRSRNFVVSPKISETRLHRETGSFETGPL